MATQSPFLFLEGFLKNLPLPNFQPPVWAVDEVQRRIVLLLNHILIQEKEATSRLTRQKGRVVHMQWRSFSVELIATPAGMLDRAPIGAKPDLMLAVTEESPLALAQAALRGDKPAVRIEGDVQLAAEVNWLVDHVQWDYEDDLSKIVGDAYAHQVVRVGHWALDAIRRFAGSAYARASTLAGGVGVK